MIAPMLPPRFWKNVKRLPNGCWLWTASTRSGGYGQIWINGTCRLAHRVTYEDHHGVILTRNVHLHHVCGRKGCVNPSHLEPLVASDHHRLHGRKQRRCKHPEHRRGPRGCRECDRLRGRRRRRAERPPGERAGGGICAECRMHFANLKLHQYYKHPTDRRT